MNEDPYSIEEVRKVKYLTKALAHDFRQNLIKAMISLDYSADLKSIKSKYAEITGKVHESSYYTQHFSILTKAGLVEKQKDDNNSVVCSLNKKYFNESKDMIKVLSELNIENKT